jgi:autotransporter strand-loop-strand O-heptosyltransferase
VIASSWWNNIFDYPEIEFVEPGSKIENVYASYEIGCYDNDNTKNKNDWRTVTLQQVASDMLGLEYQEIRPKLKVFAVVGKTHRYACFSEFSTMQAKLWNREDSWQELIDYIQDKGLDVVSISKEESKYKNITKANGRSIEETIATLAGCEFYIGLGHGPSWLAWAVGVPVIMISGFSEPWAEFPTPFRVINKGVCHGCFNDTSVKFDRGYQWCPKNKFYECTREITSAMVIEQIDKIISD